MTALLDGHREDLTPGAVLFHGLAREAAADLLEAAAQVAAAAPFRHMTTPNGRAMSVATTTCGRLGWVSDRSGYRYASLDPATGLPWPPMPASFAAFARDAAQRAGFPGFEPDSCLINRYEPGARMGLHQDRDEPDLQAPIVSLSLGLPATFLWGGLQRTARTRRCKLEHGDVLVWGGPARLTFHGIAPLKEGDHPLTGAARLNLTFRRAS